MNRIGVVGAGTMGTGIAYAAAGSSMDVVLYDIAGEPLRRGFERLSAEVRKSAEKGKLSPRQAEELLARIRPTNVLEDLRPCEAVIEAAVEVLETKRELFQKLAGICSADAIFATNTSSLSVTAIAAPVAHPERVVGMHFFNPAHIMKLVEIVQGHQSSDGAVAASRRLAEQMGKKPVIVKDTPGFIVNRVARPFYGEALRILGEGVTTVEEIDRIARLEGDFKMGPFELMDLIGIDINFAVTKSMYEQTFGEPRYRPHVIQQQMVHAGLLGRKTKRGFYTYPS